MIIQGGRNQILDRYTDAQINSKNVLLPNIEEILIFYQIKSQKHGYANAYSAYPVPPPGL